MCCSRQRSAKPLTGWASYPNLHRKPRAPAAGRGGLQRQIARAFIAHGDVGERDRHLSLVPTMAVDAFRYAKSAATGLAAPTRPVDRGFGGYAGPRNSEPRRKARPRRQTEIIEELGARPTLPIFPPML